MKENKYMFTKTYCKICRSNKEIDYKDIEFLRQYIASNAKILPRSRTGNCAKHQRSINQAIKRARILALLPFIK
ncbi:30S ribosomal protein S18 [Elusimicrobiota bacterium]